MVIGRQPWGNIPFYLLRLTSMHDMIVINPGECLTLRNTEFLQ